MKVLGLCSGRKNGNTEIMMKEVFMGIRAKLPDAECRLVRVQETVINTCVGCESCMVNHLKGNWEYRCIHPNGSDHMYFIEQMMREADAIIVSSPAYNLLPTGQLIKLLNKMHSTGNYRDVVEKENKIGAAFSIGGTDWTNFTLNTCKMIAMEMAGSYEAVVDAVHFDFMPSKGAVLLEDDILKRMNKMGSNIADALVKKANGEKPAYTSQYGTDYSNKTQANLVELAASNENIHQVEEGTVLLRNESGARPLAAGSRITVFGNAAKSGNGSSQQVTIPSVTLTAALEKTFGEENVNGILIENVYSALGETSSNTVIEAPLADILTYEESWRDDYNDAAIIVLTRLGGEDRGTAFYHEDGSHFLNLNTEERDLMTYLKQQKDAGVFGKIVLIVNTVQSMELGWLDEYGVDSCLLTSEMGATGYEGLANILCGKVNPSGRTVDAIALNSLSAPAITYGENAVATYSNTDWIHSVSQDYDEAKPTDTDSYLIYAEGIYVGYKYYETRYEDTVLKTGNADGTAGSSTGKAWSYSNEMAFPFGYGLSYTDFQQKLDGVTYDGVTGRYYVEATVTNTGAVAGKSVVEVYAQTPYGDYERANQIEKAAVMVVGFGKTSLLEPGDSETLKIEVDPYMLASYDAKGAKGYILSAGDYFLAIGDNAHDALNNILAKKGYSVADGMTAEGDPAKVYQWNQPELDTQTYRMSRVAEGVEVTNQFDHADLNNLGIEFDYLSRSDWEGTFPENQTAIEMNDTMMQTLQSGWYAQPADAPSVSSFAQGADNGLMFIDMMNVPYDDEETWKKFLDQFTVEEMASLLNDTQNAAAIDRLGIPAQIRSNDCFFAGTMVANGNPSIPWSAEVMTARTWNTVCFTSRGTIMGIESAFCGKNENWYGGGNIHRSPFSGRNRQYYSEDGNFGYIVGKYEAAAMQKQGVMYCIKHFALNDQEQNRMGVAIFATEQAIREEYLRAFEGAFVEGGAMSTMVAFNRIGVLPATEDKNLLTNVLRGEWDFKGRITPDGYSENPFRLHYLEWAEAGIDYYCLDPSHFSATITEAINNGDGYMLGVLRQMTKDNIYPMLSSTSVNGLNSGTRVVSIVPWWQKTLLIVNAVTIFGFAVCMVGTIVTGFQSGKGKKS